MKEDEKKATAPSGFEALPHQDFNALLLNKPMRFGTEVDFHLAIVELKWLRNIQGRLRDEDVKLVAAKYQIPKDMLVAEINAKLKFPDDYMISKSPWFPVLYSWALDHETAKNDLFLKVVHHQRSKANYHSARLLIPSIVVAVMLVLWNVAHDSLGYSVSEVLRLYLYLLPVIPLYIGTMVTLRLRIGDNWKPLRDLIIKMNREGQSSTVASLYHFMTSKEGSKALGYFFFFHKSDDEMLTWYERMPQFHMFQVAFLELTDSKLKEMEKDNLKEYKSRHRLGMSVLLSLIGRRLHERPPEEKREIRKVPMVVGENPHQAYRERMREILQDKENNQNKRPGKTASGP